MICKKCGTSTADVELYCKGCGADLELYSDKAKKVEFLKGVEEIKEEREIFPPIVGPEAPPGEIEEEKHISLKDILSGEPVTKKEPEEKKNRKKKRNSH